MASTTQFLKNRIITIVNDNSTTYNRNIKLHQQDNIFLIIISNWTNNVITVYNKKLHWIHIEY